MFKNFILATLMLIVNSSFAQTNNSTANLNTTSVVENTCYFKSSDITVGVIPVEYINLTNEYLFKNFSISALCTKNTLFSISSNKKAQIEVPGGMEFIYMYGQKPNNKDYLGFHIGRHKIDPTICSIDLNNQNYGIVYSSYRAAFQQVSEHTGLGEWQDIDMCIYLYLPVSRRVTQQYNKYITPDVYSTNYSFNFNF